MKKIISLILLAVMLMGVSAFAEEFTLHSGVTFEMTADEVIQKQEERGNTFAMSDGRLKNTNSIKILDLPATIYYDFGSDGKVSRQQYYFRDVNFAPLAKEFEKVYGAYDCSSLTGDTLVLPEKSFSGPLPSSYDFVEGIFGSSMMYMINHRSSDLNYYQWLVEVDDGYVAIECYGYEYYAGTKNKVPGFIGSICLVDYRHFSKEAIEGAQQENASKYDDI